MTDKLKELALRAKILDHNESPEWYPEQFIQTQGAYFPKNAAFIAAASPDAILALIKRAEDAESEVERLKSAVQDYRETLNAGGIEMPERLCDILASGAAQTSKTIDVKWHHDLAKKETDRG